MIRFRFLLRELVVRDLKSRYAGSLFGFVWAFLHPLWQLALFTVVFSYILRIPLVGERTSSFPLFLFAGLLPWLGVQEGISRSTTAIAEGANLVNSEGLPASVFRTDDWKDAEIAAVDPAAAAAQERRDLGVKIRDLVAKRDAFPKDSEDYKKLAAEIRPLMDKYKATAPKTER